VVETLIPLILVIVTVVTPYTYSRTLQYNRTSTVNLCIMNLKKQTCLLTEIELLYTITIHAPKSTSNLRHVLPHLQFIYCYIFIKDTSRSVTWRPFTAVPTISSGSSGVVIVTHPNIKW